MKNRRRFCGGVAQISAFVVTWLELRSTSPRKCESEFCGHFGGLLCSICELGWNEEKENCFHYVSVRACGPYLSWVAMGGIESWCHEQNSLCIKFVKLSKRFKTLINGLVWFEMQKPLQIWLTNFKNIWKSCYNFFNISLNWTKFYKPPNFPHPPIYNFHCGLLSLLSKTQFISSSNENQDIQVELPNMGKVMETFKFWNSERH